MAEEREIPILKKKKFLNKEGKEYEALVIIYKGYEKRVFLQGAEFFVFNDIPISN